MKECCETGAPKRRYGHWVVLGSVVLIAGAVQVGEHRFQQGMALKAMNDVSAIAGRLEEYARNNQGSYPTSLLPLVTPDANGHCYLEGCNGRIPCDPWKRPYLYEPPSATHPRPRVFTYGSDGLPGGLGEAADIDSENFAGSH